MWWRFLLWDAFWVGCNLKPGEIISTKPLVIATADKSLRLITVQPEGGKAMDGTAWAAGRRFKKGDSLI